VETGRSNRWARLLRGVLLNRRKLATIFVEAVAVFCLIAVGVIWSSGLDEPLENAVPFAATTLLVILGAAGATVALNRRSFPVTRGILVSAVALIVFTVVLAVTRSYFSLSLLAAAFVVSAVVCAQIGLLLTKNRFLRIAVLPFAEQERMFAVVGSSGLTIIGPDDDLSRFDMLVTETRAGAGPDALSVIDRAFLSGIEVVPWNVFVEERKGRVVLDRFEVGDLGWKGEQQIYVVGKRIMDLTAAMLMAIPAAILVAIAAIAIKLTDDGPVFFIQKRVGYGGKLFQMYKLRTMRNGQRLAIATAQSDNRITRVGAILRRYRIDELPQLWNIILGHMSFIGPRPEQPELVARYAAEIRGYNSRHAVTPGLSGWAQVKFGYATTTSETAEKLSYDLYYVKNISLDLDLRIGFKTIGTIFRGTGVR
jgi:lipopolysaccharide/colanic/teichoic acid biosynthesis glycosyltransferase